MHGNCSRVQHLFLDGLKTVPIYSPSCPDDVCHSDCSVYSPSCPYSRYTSDCTCALLIWAPTPRTHPYKLVSCSCLSLPIIVPTLNCWTRDLNSLIQLPLGGVGHLGRPTSCPPSPTLNSTPWLTRPFLLPAILQVDIRAQTHLVLVFPSPNAPRFKLWLDSMAS